MDVELERIAEKTFSSAMSRFSYFAEIGISLRAIQREIKKTARRVTAIEDALGHPHAVDTLPDREGSDPGKKHLSSAALQQMRLHKRLTITQMAHLLGVSIRKYTAWERGDFLMAPWGEEEILRLSKINMKDLHAEFRSAECDKRTKKPVKAGGQRPPKPPRQCRRVTKGEIRHVCDVLKLNYRLLATSLGISYSAMIAWVYQAVQPPDSVVEKFFDLQKAANQISPYTAFDVVDSLEDRTRIAAEIKKIRSQLHWTQRQLATHLHVKNHIVAAWEERKSKPSCRLSEKIKLLQEAVERGEITLEYTGEMATPEDIICLQKKLNCTQKWFERELHIAQARIKDLSSGKSKITYRETIRIRNLQRKVATGEVKPFVDMPKISREQITEILRAYQLTHNDLAKRIGCRRETVAAWKTGASVPCRNLNEKLWELWNNAPEEDLSLTTGYEIYSLRKSLGMTQRSFADMLNVTEGTVREWEHDGGSPNLENIKKLRKIKHQEQI